MIKIIGSLKLQECFKFAGKTTEEAEPSPKKVRIDRTEQPKISDKQEQLTHPGPLTRTSRKKWTTDENNAVASAFAEEIRGRCSLTSFSIKKAFDQFPCLRGRTEPQIRSKISYIVKGGDKAFQLSQ